MFCVVVNVLTTDHFVVFLSGTPTNNRPAELHAQIDALRPNEFMSFTNYTVRYVPSLFI